MKNKLKVEILRTFMAIAVAVLLLVGLIFFVSNDPMQSVYYLFLGPLSSMRGFGNILEEWIPFVFSGLCLALVFSSNNFNLAGEGAFYIGALLAMIMSTTLNISPVFFWILLIIISGFSGGIVVGFPGYIKNKTGASEIVSSIMLIFIIYNLGTYVLINFFKDPGARAMASLPFNPIYKLPVMIPKTNVHSGIFFAIIAFFVVHIFYSHTKLGYEVRITGKNKDFAKMLGINIAHTGLYAQVIGGALTGIGGSIHMLGMYTYFESKLFNYGWDGVIVATLARHNPKYVPLAALFLAYLRAGSKIMARRSDVPAEIIFVAQGIIILLIVAKNLLATYEYNLLLKSIDIEKDNCNG